MTIPYKRWRQQFGPTTMHVEPGKLTLADGATITRDQYGNPLTNPLAQALRMSKRGEIIGLRGPLGVGVRIGSAKASDVNKTNEAVRQGLEPVPTVMIVPEDDLPEQPWIAGVTIAGSINDAVGGIESLTIAGIKLLNHRLNKSNVLVEQNIRTGAFALLYCDLGSQDPTAWMGWGKMWGVRAHGLLARVDVSYNTFSEALEHVALYCDNPGWRGGSRHRVSFNKSTGRGGGRTGIQIVSREISGPRGGGHVDIEGNELRCHGGGGGGAITIAGHPGSVRMLKNTLDLQGDHSGVVVWTDRGKGKLYLTDSGHSTGRVLIDDLVVRGGNRPHVAVSGAERLDMVLRFQLERGAGETLERCIDLDNSYGGGIDCGRVRLLRGEYMGAASKYPGFRSGAKVVRDEVALTDAQIDALVPA